MSVEVFLTLLTRDIVGNGVNLGICEMVSQLTRSSEGPAFRLYELIRRRIGRVSWVDLSRVGVTLQHPLQVKGIVCRTSGTVAPIPKGALCHMRDDKRAYRNVAGRNEAKPDRVSRCVLLFRAGVTFYLRPAQPAAAAASKILLPCCCASFLTPTEPTPVVSSVTCD